MEGATLFCHCAVEVEPGFAFISGNGYSGSEKVFSSDPATKAFDSLPDMTQGRCSVLGCGVVNKEGSEVNTQEARKCCSKSRNPSGHDVVVPNGGRGHGVHTEKKREHKYF